MITADPRVIARVGLLERYRADGVTARVVAAGRSMHPLIPAGSELLVEFGQQPSALGDVIVFRRGRGVVAHRLVARRVTQDGMRLLVKGDDEAFIDAPLRAEDVLGVVREVRLPDGSTTRSMRGRRRSAALARVSWWSGCAAGVGARVARRTRASDPVRRVALFPYLFLSRVPTRLVTALIPRLDRGATSGRR